MRTSSINIKGKDHLMCFSARAINACVEKYGSVDNLYSNMNAADGSGLSAVLWFISVLLEAGDRYAKHNGIANEEPPTHDDLLDTYGLDDLEQLTTAIQEAITAGSEETVKTEETKKAKTTGSK